MRIGWRAAALASATLLLSFGAHSALSSDSKSTVSARGIAAVTVVRNTEPVSLSTACEWVDIPGGSVTVPARWTNGLVLVRFSGDARCETTHALWCSVRVLVDGAEAEPAVGLQNAFAAQDMDFPTCCGLTENFESHSIDRSLDQLGPGEHVITVQGASPTSSTFTLNDWSLTIELARVS